MLEHAWTIISFVYAIGVLIAIDHVLRTRRDPRGMMSWLLALIFLPGVGLVLFLLIGKVSVDRRVRRWSKRRRRISPALSDRRKTLDEAHDALDIPDLEPSQRILMDMASNMCDALVTTGNEVWVDHDAESSFLNMSLAIEAAESHIHLEYYIFADDDTGRAMRDLLIKKAAQGVEVRLLLDEIGSWKLSRSFVRSLRECGVKVAFFLPWGVSGRRLHINCRNHRKIGVIDGRVAFLESKNIADEYLGRKKKLGPWRDTNLRMRGPVVAQIQEIFVDDWHFTTQEALTADRYFPQPKIEGNRIVQIVPSGPDGKAHLMYQLLFAAMSDAGQTISIMTPYFVPDPAMILALQSAAYRGVKVRLLLPSQSDHYIVLWAGRATYEELLEAGVEIYEYAAGMMHSKVVAVDQRWAMVGSANMDVRSFRLNFEVTAILYDNSIAHGVHQEFEALMKQSKRISIQQIKDWSYPENLAAGIARLAAPLL